MLKVLWKCWNTFSKIFVIEFLLQAYKQQPLQPYLFLRFWKIPEITTNMEFLFSEVGAERILYRHATLNNFSRNSYRTCKCIWKGLYNGYFSEKSKKTYRWLLFWFTSARLFPKNQTGFCRKLMDTTRWMNRDRDN